MRAVVLPISCVVGTGASGRCARTTFVTGKGTRYFPALGS